MGAHGWVADCQPWSVILSRGPAGQLRPLDIPGTHLPYSTMKLLTLITHLIKLTFLQLVLLGLFL